MPPPKCSREQQRDISPRKKILVTAFPANFRREAGVLGKFANFGETNLTDEICRHSRTPAGEGETARDGAGRPSAPRPAARGPGGNRETRTRKGLRPVQQLHGPNTRRGAVRQVSRVPPVRALQPRRHHIFLPDHQA